MVTLFKKIFGGSTENVEPTADENASNDEIQDLEHFVDYVTKSLVDSPNDVHVLSEDGTKENTTIIKIECNQDDIGKIIGKRGQTIMAIRTLVNGAAGRLQKRILVEVAD